MLRIVPIDQKTAFRFIAENHTHNEPPVGTIFQIGCSLNGDLIGVATCGRPTNYQIDHKKVIDVSRCCVKRDMPYPNACSMLYGRCARIAREMGYHKITTYTLESEPGTSLKASGWFIEAEKCGGKKGFNSSGSRVRTNVIHTLFETRIKSPEEGKVRWAKLLSKEQEDERSDAMKPIVVQTMVNNFGANQ